MVAPPFQRNAVNLGHCARFVLLSRAIDKTDSSSYGLRIEPQERPQGHSRTQSVFHFPCLWNQFLFCFICHGTPIAWSWRPSRVVWAARRDPIFYADSAARPPPLRSPLCIFRFRLKLATDMRDEAAGARRGKGVPWRLIRATFWGMPGLNVILVRTLAIARGPPLRPRLPRPLFGHQRTLLDPLHNITERRASTSRLRRAYIQPLKSPVATMALSSSSSASSASN